MRALVTGADGFVGKVLSAHLRERGWEVFGCDRASRADADSAPCDITIPQQIDDVFDAAGPLTHVFHLAAVTFVPESGRNPAGTFEVNLQGTVNLLDAVKRRAPGARVIFIGSAECYGPPQFLPITETHPLNPVNPYAISKAAGDSYCAYAGVADHLDITRMRPFNHSGPGQADAFVLSNFARQIAQIEKGEIPPVIRVGNLDAARDFSHVQDVVRAYEAVAREGVAGEAYNVCSGRATTVREALDRLLSFAHPGIEVVGEAARFRPTDVAEIWGSHEKLSACTGWHPEIPLEALLTDLLDFWLARG